MFPIEAADLLVRARPRPQDPSPLKEPWTCRFVAASLTEFDPSAIAGALSWLVRERREHGGRPSPPWSVDELRAWAEQCQQVRGEDAVALLKALDVDVGGDDLKFGVAGSDQRLDFGTLTSLIERCLDRGIPDDFVELLEWQPALQEPTARALRSGVGASFAARGGADLRHLLLDFPGVLEAAAEPASRGSGVWLGVLLSGDLRFLSIADAFGSAPARVAVLLAVGSPAARTPAEEALIAWIDSAERPDKQALARLVDASRQLGPAFLLQRVEARPDLSSVLTRSERTAAWLHLDPRPLRELLWRLVETDVEAAAEVLVGVGATDPHLTNRVLKGQTALVAALDAGFAEPHHRLYAWGATGSDDAIPPAAEALTALIGTWASSKPVVDRSRAMPGLLDHPCLSPRLLGALQERGLLELEELFVVLVRDPHGPGDWGDPPWPLGTPEPIEADVGEHLVGWLCSSPPGRLTALSAGPTGLSVSRLLDLSCLAWSRGQVALPVLLGLGRAFGLGRAGPDWVAEAILRFLDTLSDAIQRRDAAAELLDLLQPEPTSDGEVAVCDSVARALPAAVAEPFVDFAITRDWATHPGRAGELRERQARSVLDALELGWRRRNPRRLRPILTALFHDDVAAVAEATTEALRGAVRDGLDPRWLVPAVLAGARAHTLDRLQGAMVDQRLRSDLREATLEALQSGHPHPMALDVALRRAGAGSVLRERVVEAARDRLLPALLEGVLQDAVDGTGARSRLQRNVIEGILAAHEDDPATLARALDRVLAQASWAGDVRWLTGVVEAAGVLGEAPGGLCGRLDEIASSEQLPEPLRSAARAAADAIRDPAIDSPRRRVGRSRRCLVEAWTA
jgi:hypothetical protein